MNELNNCPFCGGKAEWNKHSPRCSKCYATVPAAKGFKKEWFIESGYKNYMASLWNRRIST